ncbi:MAG: T9SS type A sorting domain-containing protein [Candidatus Fermentibacteria bacterium]|nr:T9SS type A sorting domain-containing protein [Candidatus Fermentibacteria bacterium]
MTGLSVSNNHIFLGSRSQKRVYYYSLPGITTLTLFSYLSGSGNNTCDIAMNAADSLVWVASESTEMAVTCYNSNNTMVDYIDISLVPNARGLTLDPSGYLWVSDIDADKLYKIDLTEGIEDNGTGQALNVVPSANPFSGAVTFQAQGVTGTVTVFDMYGRQVESEGFQNAWTWNSSAPAGTYVFVIRDDQGASATVELVKI